MHSAYSPRVARWEPFLYSQLWIGLMQSLSKTFNPSMQIRGVKYQTGRINMMPLCEKGGPLDLLRETDNMRNLIWHWIQRSITISPFKKTYNPQIKSLSFEMSLLQHFANWFSRYIFLLFCAKQICTPFYRWKIPGFSIRLWMLPITDKWAYETFQIHSRLKKGVEMRGRVKELTPTVAVQLGEVI